MPFRHTGSTAGSLAFWNNLATWHLALTDYHGERRLMHRITIGGGPRRRASTEVGSKS